jgi:hypothetical protein
MVEWSSGVSRPNSVEHRSMMEYGTVVRRELGRVLEMTVEGDQEEVARKELYCDKKTSRVI